MKQIVLAALLGYSSAVKLQHHHRHHHHHQATPLTNFHPWPRNNWESADIDADNSRASNDIPEHCIHNVAGHCGITSSKQVAQPTVHGPQPAQGTSVIYPVNNMIAQVASGKGATPLTNFHPWPRNNWESADIDADNSRASNDIPEHCIHNVAGHCGITSSKQVAQPTEHGPQPAQGTSVIYPVNNMIAQVSSGATPLTNFHPWPRNNWEASDIDADNSRASNDIPEHCIHNVAGHCGITSSKQVAQPTEHGPQPAQGTSVIYPVNNMIVQTDATPLSNFHPWPRNNWEASDIDADNSRASNDIPEHCIHNVAGHCGITSSKQVAQPSVHGPQPAQEVSVIYPVNNMIVQTEVEGAPAAPASSLYVPYKYAGLKGFDLNKLEQCPDFNERMTLSNGKTKAVSYPNAGYNCNANYGL